MTQTYKIHRDDAPDLVFTGDLVATVSSRSHGHPRWTELSLFKTNGGLFVCHSLGCTSIPKESPRSAAVAVHDYAEVIEYFGHGRLAKKLYHISGIADVEVLPDTNFEDLSPNSVYPSDETGIFQLPKPKG